jgi:hypothetical protein
MARFFSKKRGLVSGLKIDDESTSEEEELPARSQHFEIHLAKSWMAKSFFPKYLHVNGKSFTTRSQTRWRGPEGKFFGQDYRMNRMFCCIFAPMRHSAALRFPTFGRLRSLAAPTVPLKNDSAANHSAKILSRRAVCGNEVRGVRPPSGMRRVRAPGLQPKCPHFFPGVRGGNGGGFFPNPGISALFVMV